jgi:hypothetical protein
MRWIAGFWMMLAVCSAGCACTMHAVCAVQDVDKKTPEEGAIRNARPILTIHAPDANPPRPIGDNTSITIATTAEQTVYFTVDAYFSETGQNPVRKGYHFVLGGSKQDGTNGIVRVNGFARLPDGTLAMSRDEAALIRVEEGWVWVSDKAPPVRTPSASREPAGEGVFRAVSFQPSAGTVTNEPVSWSNLSLLRAQWTWAGAIGTEFVYRVRPRAAGTNKSPIEVVYGIGKQTQISIRIETNGISSLRRRPVEEKFYRQTTADNKIGFVRSSIGDPFLSEVLHKVGCVKPASPAPEPAPEPATEAPEGTATLDPPPAHRL